jgi:cell wall-associated NlpC family hydrolase
MKYYFEDTAKCEVLYDELRSWLRTPFKHGVGVKGMGCDCIHFVLRVYEAIGAIKPGLMRVPNYPKDWHVHNSEELLYNKFKSLSMFEELEMKDGLPVVSMMDGDVYLHKYGLANSHSSIYCRDKIYHSINGVGVQDTAWYDEKWSSTRKCGFRMLAL